MSETTTKKKKKSSSSTTEPPVTAVERLQSLNLISRIATEYNNHLGISDRTLAEFIINLSEKSIKSYLKEEFVKDGGSLYHVNLIDDTDSTKLRIGLISSSIENDITTINSFKNDLISNGAGSNNDISNIFASRILRIVCDMSPRIERMCRKMNEKKMKKLKKLQSNNNGGAEGGGGRLTEGTNNSRKLEIGNQFPGLAGKNLVGSVPLEDGFYEHNKNSGGNVDGKESADKQQFDIHARSRNKRKGDNDNGEANNIVDSSKRSKSNLPAWMATSSENNASESNNVKETGARSKSNLPAWMTKNQPAATASNNNGGGGNELKLYQIYTGTISRILDFGIVVDLNIPNNSSPDKTIQGMVHTSNITKNRIDKPRDANLRPNQKVYIKLISIGQRGVIGVV